MQTWVITNVSVNNDDIAGLNDDDDSENFDGEADEFTEEGFENNIFEENITTTSGIYSFSLPFHDQQITFR